MTEERAVILARGLGTRMRQAADGDLPPDQASAAASGAKAMMPLAVGGPGGNRAAPLYLHKRAQSLAAWCRSFASFPILVPASDDAAEDAALDKDDMVTAIRAGGHARAYPIRMMGYHHIVNDWVGGKAVVATY